MSKRDDDLLIEDIIDGLLWSFIHNELQYNYPLLKNISI